MNIKAFLNTLSERSYCLPIVILYVTSACNLRCVMCSYRKPSPNELSLEEFQSLADQLGTLGLRHIVYSGGEPLTRSDFPEICKIFSILKVKQTLLTNGVLLTKRLHEVKGQFKEIIVSLDGPTSKVHDSIRGAASFDTITSAIAHAVNERGPRISIRTVVQKSNFRHLSAMVNLAKRLKVHRISFLAADVLSSAFHRNVETSTVQGESILLNENETDEFRQTMNLFISDHKNDISSRFISETGPQLFHIVQYFEALAGKAPFPINTCNAPMNSAVITSTGDLLPCFFLPKFGNIRTVSLKNHLNNATIQSIRRDVRSYTLDRCQKCVCTLHVPPHLALANKF